MEKGQEIQWFADRGGPIHTVPTGANVAFVMKDDSGAEGRVTLKFEGDKVSVTRFTMDGDVSVSLMSLKTKAEDVNPT